MIYSTMYDIIIIGAGISGLYAAYKIQKMSPHKKVLVLEKTPKKYIGGRAGNRPFHGASIAIGAGVGRKEKDVFLYRWLQELGLDIHEFQAKNQYAQSIAETTCTLHQSMISLKKAYKTNPPKLPLTFKQFAKPILGEKAYQEFLQCAGFTDYEEEDIHDVLFYYGFEDNYSEWTGFSVPWSLLIQTVCEKVFHKETNASIKPSSEVMRIRAFQDQTLDLFEIAVKDAPKQYAKQIIMATTIESVLRLLPAVVPPEMMQYYRQIHGQPFLRIYGQFSKNSRATMAKYVSKQTIVAGPIHKLIPIDPEKGVYMIVYTDNQGAKTLKKYTENTAENRAKLEALLVKALGIPDPAIEPLNLLDMQSFYWPIGTHYYEPLRGSYKNRRTFIKAIQRPAKNVMVVGEMVALNQGWVEGALESVDALM